MIIKNIEEILSMKDIELSKLRKQIEDNQDFELIYQLENKLLKAER